MTYVENFVMPQAKASLNKLCFYFAQSQTQIIIVIDTDY